MSPLVSSAGVGPIFTITTAGVEGLGSGSGSYFDAGYAAVPGVPSSGTAFFQVRVWWGATYFNGAPLQGSTPVWSQPVGTADAGPPPTPGMAVSLNIPERLSMWVPEPSTIALAGLGLAGLLLLRPARSERAAKRLEARRPNAKGTQMRTTLLAILAIGAALAPATLPAQGTVYLNNYDSGMGIYLPGDTTAPAPAGTFVEVFGGASPTTMVPLRNSAGIGPIFTIPTFGVEDRGPGSGSYFDVGYSAVPGVPPDGTAFFEIFTWAYAATFPLAVFRDQSPVWSQSVGSADNPGPPPPPVIGVSLNIPAPLNLWVPEPSTIALAGLGLAGWLAFRRRRWGNLG